MGHIVLLNRGWSSRISEYARFSRFTSLRFHIELDLREILLTTHSTHIPRSYGAHLCLSEVHIPCRLKTGSSATTPTFKR